ncbi:MAG: hypothetical protein ABSA43_02175 [Candidatus Microgenomates bacterium]|jgi:hypothetical protein
MNSVGYLTLEEIIEFQKLCKEVYGRDLTYGEAEDQGTRAVMLIDAIAKSLKPQIRK